jgi:hypothetical protein
LLDEYLSLQDDFRLRSFNAELKNLYEAVVTSKFDKLLHMYHNSEWIRNLWGTPNHYICFRKLD